MKKILSLFSLFVLLSSVAFAQESVVISPQSIVVNPKPSFGIEVFTDRDTSGDSIPTYQIGEQITIGVRVSSSAYIYLFNIKSNGEIQQILPNRYDQQGQNNFLEVGQTRYFPRPDAPYTFDIAGPRGLDKVIAVASKDPLDTSQLASFSNDPNFASSNVGESSFAQSLSIVVRPKPQNSWVTDTALLYVGSAPATPVYGTLNITSNPSGAEAYVDGQFVGYTPVRYGTQSGSHEVRVQLSGYNTFSSNVNLSGGQSLRVDAGLTAVRRTGTVSFSSQPRGAQVYVNGSLIGTTPTASATLDEGSYQARFSLRGYSDTTTNFTVNANSSQSVSGNLQPLSGTLVITANVGGAAVLINGQQVGIIPSGSGRLTVPELPTGSHELVVAAPGFRTFMTEFQIDPGQTTEIRVQQSRR
ncbi:PEGA domain-containing protein [soil metagenome]